MRVDVLHPDAGPMRHSVLIVEDDVRLRDGITRVIDAEGDLRVVGVAGGVAEGLRLVNTLRPEVLLVDLALPDGNGIALIRHVAQFQPPCHPIVITIFDDSDGVIECIRAGAVGYLLKDARGMDIAHQIREVCRGGSSISPGIARRLFRWVISSSHASGPSADPGAHAPEINADLLPALSTREVEVLGLCAKGFTYTEIGELLGIQRTTVATHVQRIYEKLQVHSKTEAVYEARKVGLLDD